VCERNIKLILRSGLTASNNKTADPKPASEIPQRIKGLAYEDNHELIIY
jgi:hypothetical protein